MKQSTIFLIIAIVVALIGNIFVYQMKTNPDSGFNRLLRNPNSNNYQWNDNWNENNQNQDRDERDSEREQYRDERDEERDQYRDERPDNQIVANSYQDALEKSRQSGKPVLLFFDKSNCRYCDQMKQRVLSDPNVRQLLKQYVFVFINTDERQNKEIAYRYKIVAAPTCVIIDSNENQIGRVRGYQEAQEYSSWLENPPEPEKRFPWRRR